MSRSDEQFKLLTRFVTIKVKNIVSENGQMKYLKSLDHVIEDIFGYQRFGSKLDYCSTEQELQFVMRSFGVENLQIFRNSSLCDALSDLVQMDYDIRRMRKQFQRTKDKGQKVRRSDAKVYDRLTKLYRKTIRVICHRMGLKDRSARKLESSYKSAKLLVNQQKGLDFYGEFGFFDEDGDFFLEDDTDPGVDYFEQFLRNRGYSDSTRMRSRHLDDEEGFDELIAEQVYPRGSVWNPDDTISGLVSPEEARQAVIRRRKIPAVSEAPRIRTVDPQMDELSKKISNLTDLVTVLAQTQLNSQHQQAAPTPRRRIVRIPQPTRNDSVEPERPLGYSILEKENTGSAITPPSNEEHQEREGDITAQQLIEMINQGKDLDVEKHTEEPKPEGEVTSN